MMRIIVTAHGRAASSTLGAVEMILGPLDEDVIGIDFSANDTLSLLSEQIESHLHPTMTTIFCDIKGGTPFNAAYLLAKKYPIQIICGMNLGMLLECLLLRSQGEPVSLLETAKQAGMSAIETFDFTKEG